MASGSGSNPPPGVIRVGKRVKPANSFVPSFLVREEADVVELIRPFNMTSLHESSRTPDCPRAGYEVPKWSLKKPSSGHGEPGRAKKQLEKRELVAKAKTDMYSLSILKCEGAVTYAEGKKSSADRSGQMEADMKAEGGIVHVRLIESRDWLKFEPVIPKVANMLKDEVENVFAPPLREGLTSGFNLAYMKLNGRFTGSGENNSTFLKQQQVSSEKDLPYHKEKEAPQASRKLNGRYTRSTGNASTLFKQEQDAPAKPVARTNGYGDNEVSQHKKELPQINKKLKARSTGGSKDIYASLKKPKGFPKKPVACTNGHGDNEVSPHKKELPQINKKLNVRSTGSSKDISASSKEHKGSPEKPVADITREIQSPRRPKEPPQNNTKLAERCTGGTDDIFAFSKQLNGSLEKPVVRINSNIQSPHRQKEPPQGNIKRKADCTGGSEDIPVISKQPKGVPEKPSARFNHGIESPRRPQDFPQRNMRPNARYNGASDNIAVSSKQLQGSPEKPVAGGSRDIQPPRRPKEPPQMNMRPTTRYAGGREDVDAIYRQFQVLPQTPIPRINRGIQPPCRQKEPPQGNVKRNAPNIGSNEDVYACLKQDKDPPEKPLAHTSNHKKESPQGKAEEHFSMNVKQGQGLIDLFANDSNGTTSTDEGDTVPSCNRKSTPSFTIEVSNRRGDLTPPSRPVVTRMVDDDEDSFDIFADGSADDLFPDDFCSAAPVRYRKL